ncbi:MAG: M20/M25/M40 family metallo-hydrolase [Acidobacteriota bacterium]
MPFSISSPRHSQGFHQAADLLRQAAVRTAFEIIDRRASQFTAEHVRICEIPAPPFQEQERGDYLESRFRELGLTDVHRDEVGNVIGIWPGKIDAPRLTVFSAHLDTVFPAGTDVRVRQVGSRLCAPGIGDDSAGLAALTGLIELLRDSAIQLRTPVAFVATVGEEGEGDLRGVRHLFTAGRLANQIGAFISFDGTGVDWITHQALGSKRYRIRLDGPGGHSWGDFGVVNPVHAMGRLVARLADYPAPLNPRTSYNVGRITGGESVNVIPITASVDIDLRSEAATELSRLEDFLLEALNQAVSAENSLRAAAGRRLTSEVRVIGSRPTGEIPADHPLVRAAIDVATTLGIRPWLNRNSTDSNIPLSLGIPAITIGAGGVSGDPHRLSEWYDPRGRELGVRRALLLLLILAGLAEGKEG